MSLSVYGQMGMCIWHQLSVELEAQAVVSHPMWFRGAELWFWRRAVHALCHGAISPAPPPCIESGFLIGHEHDRPFLSASVVLQVEMLLSPNFTWMLEICQMFMLAWQALPQCSHFPEPWLDLLLWLNKPFCSYICATFSSFACWLTLELFIPRVCCN